jgi:outer membrane protein insertion porin family
MRITVIKGFLLIFFILYNFCSYADSKVTKISIENNHRIDSKTVEKYLQIKIGDVFNDKLEIEAVKNLYSTEFFDDLSINFNNGILLVKVYETPMISEVKFEGNSKIKSHDLENLISLYKGDSYHQPTIDLNIKKIIQLYNSVGRYLINVKVEKVKLDNNRVKLIFKISEGPKTKIKNISFIGNKNFSQDMLKKNIKTSETTWYSFMSKDDVYDPSRIDYDIYMLKNFYASKGYIDFKSISVISELSKTKKYFNLVYTIDEGNKYKFGEYSIKNEVVEIKTDLTKFLDPIKTNLTYNEDFVQKIIDNISAKLEKDGYGEMQISRQLDKNSNDKTVNITFVITKLNKFYINKINIIGNRKTRDSVIRNKLQIYEGDLYNKRKIESGIRRVRNTNYFEYNIETSEERDQNSIDKYDLNIKVEEKSTTSLGFSGGWSSVGGMFGNINLREINLGGTGKLLDLLYNRSSSVSNYSLMLMEPHFLDANISVGGKVFRKVSIDSDLSGKKKPYSQDIIGFQPRIGYQITPDLNHSLAWLIQTGDVILKKETDKKISRIIKEQAGKGIITSSIISGLSFDRLDNRHLPKYGYLLSADHEFAGLGGDIHFFKQEYMAQFFHSFLDEKLTFKLEGEVGYIFPLKGQKNDSLRIIDRFDLGEPRMRGFESQGVGPCAYDDQKDKKERENLGGDKYYLVKAELIMPIKNERGINISLVGFMDFGSIWGLDVEKISKQTEVFNNSDSLRISTGIGIIVNTDIIPIRIDFGFPLKKEKHDKEQVVSIGSSINL